MRYALLLFILMPIIEIAVLLRVGSAIGWLSTLGVVILTAIIGTVMLRQQGLATLTRAQQRLGAGEMPAEQMLEGVALMIGGVLLLTPGFVTDAFGFMCLIPPTRLAILRFVKSRSTIGLAGVVAGSTPRSAAGSQPGSQPGSHPGSHSGAPGPKASSSNDVIDGDFHRVD